MNEEKMLVAALDCARNLGFNKMSHQDIALYADCTKGLVVHYLGSIESVRDLVMAAAVAARDTTVLAQGLVHRHPVALKAPMDLKILTLKTFLSEAV